MSPPASKPTLCIIGGCNGAGKTTLARELLPRMGLMRFLNADEIARGVAFLCGEDAGFVTGSTLSINGGQHMY